MTRQDGLCSRGWRCWCGRRSRRVLAYGVTCARLEQLRNHACPTGLVGRPHPASVVAVETFVEGDVVGKVRIALKLGVKRVHLANTVLILQEQASEAAGQFLRNLIERDVAPRTCGTLHLEIVAVVVMKFL